MCLSDSLYFHFQQKNKIGFFWQVWISNVMNSGPFVILREDQYDQLSLATHECHGQLLATRFVILGVNVCRYFEKSYFGHHHEQTKATPKCYGLVIMHINENHAHVGMVHGYIDDPSPVELRSKF